MVIPIFERWGLNPREQRVATIAVFVLGAFLLLGIPVGLSSLVSSRRADNEELKEALSAVNGARAKIRERQERRSSISSRYAKKAPQLGGYLEQTAGASKLQVSDSADRPDVNHGKHYVERHTVIHLKNAGMGPIAKFLEALENSGYPIAITRLNIRRRTGEPDSYGPVEIGVSAYDRNAGAGSTAGAASATPDGSKSDKEKK
jgi:general secretion pathway protein M